MNPSFFIGTEVVSEQVGILSADMEADNNWSLYDPYTHDGSHYLSTQQYMEGTHSRRVKADGYDVGIISDAYAVAAAQKYLYSLNIFPYIAGFTGDDFTGDNGDPLNPDYWIQDDDNNPDWDIQSNKGNMVHNGTAKTNNINSLWAMRGNFDIQIDWILNVIPPETFGLYFYMGDDIDVNFIRINLEGNSTTHRYESRYKINGSNSAEIQADTTETSGKFRFIRAGNVYTTYHLWTTGTYEAYGVYINGGFAYLANGSHGLSVYSVDGSGNLIYLDSDDQGDEAHSTWHDGNFLYLANYGGGLHSYSVDGNGNLTHIDSDDPGGNARGVWGDGTFIYLASGNGLHTYTVDGSGNLTHVDDDDPGGYAYGVWGDGTFVYLANSDGLHSYSVDGSGNLTHIDFDARDKAVRGVYGDGTFLYVANGSNGALTYSVDGSGNLTHIDSDDQGEEAIGVWTDGTFIYVTYFDDGLHTYSVDGSGNLTHIDSDDQGGYAYGVYGDGSYIYVGNGNNGVHTYSVDGSGNLTYTAGTIWIQFGHIPTLPGTDGKDIVMRIGSHNAINGDFDCSIDNLVINSGAVATADFVKKYNIRLLDGAGDPYAYNGNHILIGNEWNNISFVLIEGPGGSDAQVIISYAESNEGIYYVDDIRYYSISSDMVEIYPNWNYRSSKKFLGSKHRAKTGEMYRYKTGQYKEFEFTADYVPGSKALRVNDWWQSSATMLFAINSAGAVEINTVAFDNKKKPFHQMNKPYTEYYKGKIRLSGA